ncbi:MAG TPA: chemotaxis protein CheW [Verrucomicrobiota bacterium]|nr:chemotaxis protein CheW [Verrucomicrobiota bacterium]OQB90695.1 MAG: CheW-like domain protein [Verrucomicrobia bacterium ADurb.Bin118]HPY30563.1 chemotaxis protein CheW [Verrucomicrobiota bacterium]HQB15727.1 chemotaxis protein CheW [Verrucomicrobiota bacterium]
MAPPSAKSSLPAPPAPASALTPLDECWHRIGVYGDGSCPELARQVHCRNCPTFTRAAAGLLNRDLPVGYRQQWAAHYAQAKHRAAPWDISTVIFRLGTEWFALDTVLLQEIAEDRPMHTLPHRRRGVVLGVVNIRGELLLLVSLARLLQPHAPGAEEFTARCCPCVLVVHAQGNRFAFAVDETPGVQRFHQTDLMPPPVTATQAVRTFTRGLLRWNGHSVGWLDADALLFHLNRSLA